MSIPAGAVAAKLAFQVSPIILTGGIATFTPAGMLPIVSLTEAVNFVDGLLGGANLDIDNFFANFMPMQGSTAIDLAIGNYPFANQSVAANAVIFQPLKISMQMVVPARGPAGYAAKLAAMMGLQATLQQHNLMGGTYTVVTPSIFYPNCILISMRDVSNQASKQPQNTWQLDFVQPLVTLSQAAQAQNASTSRTTMGLPSDGSLSGIASTVGSVPTLSSVAVVPAASSALGAGVAGVGSYALS